MGGREGGSRAEETDLAADTARGGERRTRQLNAGVAWMPPAPAHRSVEQLRVGGAQRPSAGRPEGGSPRHDGASAEAQEHIRRGGKGEMQPIRVISASHAEASRTSTWPTERSGALYFLWQRMGPSGIGRMKIKAEKR